MTLTSHRIDTTRALTMKIFNDILLQLVVLSVIYILYTHDYLSWIID